MVLATIIGGLEEEIGRCLVSALISDSEPVSKNAKHSLPNFKNTRNTSILLNIDDDVWTEVKVALVGVSCSVRQARGGRGGVEDNKHGKP